jgi:RsiW-degrading membrane proteinase PrsW (M82 family)
MSKQPVQPAGASANPYKPSTNVYIDMRRSLNSDLSLAPAKQSQIPQPFEISRQLIADPRLAAATPIKLTAAGQPASAAAAKTPMSTSKKALLWLVLICVLLVVGYLAYQHGGKLLATGYDKMINMFEYLATFREPWKTVILTLTTYFVQILGIPIFCIICMIVSFCYSSYLMGFAVCMTVCILSNITLYFAMMMAHETLFADDSEEQPLLGHKQHKPMQFHEFLGVVMKEYIQEHPIQFGLAFRTMHIPDYPKMFIITKYNATLAQMLIPCVCVDSLNILLYCFIGSQIHNRFDFFSSKAFDEKSIAEKIVTVVSAVLIVFQIVVLVAGFIYTSRKYAQYQADKAEHSTNLHSDGQDDAIQPAGSILVPSTTKCTPQAQAALSTA